MAWNARAVVVSISLAACAARAAVGQVMADDHPDLDPPTRINAGATAGRFDHRVPRAPDSDLYLFRTQARYVYRATLHVDTPARDEQEASNFWSLAPDLFGAARRVTLHVLSGNEHVFIGDGRDALVEVSGLAHANGTSVPYSVDIEELAQLPAEPAVTPQTARVVAVGEWKYGELNHDQPWWFDMSTVADAFACDTVAGRRYRVEVETLSASPMPAWAFIGGYAEPVDSRFSAFTDLFSFPYARPRSESIDTIVPGRLVAAVQGYLTSFDARISYRARIVDDGPAVFDDHSDWAANATPLQLGVPMQFTLNDLPRESADSRAIDLDCFSVELQAGRRYSIVLAEAPGVVRHWSVGMWITSGQGEARNAGAFTADADNTFKPPSTGTYIINCAASWFTLRRTICVTDLGPTGDDHPDGPTGEPPWSGGVYTGVLEDGRDGDMVRLAAPAGSVVRAELIGEDDQSPLQVTLLQFDSGGPPYTIATLLQLGTDAARLSGEATVPTWMGGDRYIIVGRPYPIESAPPRQYQVRITVVDATASLDDWSDSPVGATVLTPGAEPLWANVTDGNDRDVFLADFVVGHLYAVTGGPEVCPIADFGRSGARAYAQRLFQVAATGRYALIYSGGTFQVGIEDLGVVQDDFPPTSNVPKIAVGATVNGMVDLDGDVDQWQIDADEDGLFEIEVVSRSDLSLTFAGQSDYGYMNTWSIMGRDTPQTRRVVRSRSYGQLVPLTVSVSGSVYQDPHPYQVTVRKIASMRGGSAVDAPLGVWVGTRPMPRLEPIQFRVPVVAGHLYVIERQTDVFGGNRLTVTDPDGSLVFSRGEAWVAGSTGVAMLTCPPGAAWSFVRVTDGGIASDDHAASWSGATPIGLGETVNGVFDFAGDVDAFKLPFRVGVTYRVWLQLGGAQPPAYAVANFGDPRLDYGDSLADLYNQSWPIALLVPSYYGGEPGYFGIELPREQWSDEPVPYTFVVREYCAADIGGAGGSAPDGRLDNNDFIVFINSFFMGSWEADVGKAGAVPGADDALDSNDFIVYVSSFFAGCP